MKRGFVPVEQVDTDGNIVEGFDNSLSTSEIYALLEQNFPGIYKDENGIICGCIGQVTYSIRIKNITYLGIPHPTFKKRIQISDDLQSFYRISVSNGYVPLLLGIYTYEGNLIFCDFNIEDYVVKKAHNSSAHVYTGDIAAATKNDIFQKEDFFGNKITVFSPNGIKAFFVDKLSNLEDYVPVVSSTINSSTIREAVRELTPVHSGFPNVILWKIWDFFDKESKCWFGIDCYREMMAADFNNKFQPEWVGFFYEYRFDKYIKANRIENLIRYEQNKKAGSIDLDLYFPTIGQYGDLKAHSENSGAIQGNDWGTVQSILDANGHIYYVVCEHSTSKDSEHGFEVTRFWNMAQHKDNLMSYSGKMKNRVILKKALVLDINAGNRVHLTKFKQGVNSNGALRQPKIMVENDKLEHFLLASRNL